MLGSRVVVKFLRQMQISFVVSPKRPVLSGDNDYVDDEVIDDLPEDVKEGHFVVHTFEHGEVNRFVLTLDYLDHPEFVKLLEKAEEEFGFRTKGVLAVPCGPNVLQKILENKNK